MLEPEEVQALVRAAACEQDGAIYLSAAYTGLRRGELLALRWREPRERGRWTGDDDLVFVGELGGHLDGSALRRRFNNALQRAGLRKLRFHDLRHTFGTRMIAKADILRVKEWMGHADVQTTMRYLHFTPRPDDARLVAEAFALPGPSAPLLAQPQLHVAAVEAPVAADA